MKNKIIFLLISILLNVIFLSLIRLYLWMALTCVIAFILYFILTILIFNKLKNESFIIKLFIVLIGTIIVHVPIRIIDFKSQLISFPEFICELIGLLFGLLFFYLDKKKKIITITLGVFFTLFIYTNYESILYSLNFSNLIYKNINKIKIDGVTFSDRNHKIVNNSIFDSEKYVMLNIWSTSCGACIAEFPEIDSLYLISKNSNQINIYTACILENQDSNIPFEYVEKKKYSFPIFTIASWEDVIREYDMDGVPVTFVIKNKKIIYRGDLQNSWNKILKLTSFN